MEQEHVTCDLCHSTQTHEVIRVHDINYSIPGEFCLVQCEQCQLIYLNPRPSQSDYSAIYPEASYDPFQPAHGTEIAKPNRTVEQRARMLTKLLRPGKLLDIGCADGKFMVAMQEQGWKCSGVEPSASAVALAQSLRHLNVQQGTILNLDEFQSYNLITFWDVLEHVPSPKAALERAYRLLVPGGIIAISVPNWGSLERLVFRQNWIALDAPRHFYHFAPPTLSHLLSACHFQIVTLYARAPTLSLASNILRTGGNWILRHGKDKTPADLNSPTRGTLSLQRHVLVRLVHLGASPFNALLNLIGRGSTLTVIAKQVPFV